jgi:hypothetical protein
VEELVKQEEIEQEHLHDEQIQLLYMVLQEKEKKIQDKANKEANGDVNNTPDDDYYKPFCLPIILSSRLATLRL